MRMLVYENRGVAKLPLPLLYIVEFDIKDYGQTGRIV